MARSDLLISLFESGSQGDLSAFRRSAESLIAEERAKKHFVLAERLTQTLKSGFRERQTSRITERTHSDYCLEETPRIGFDKLFLSDDTASLCREVIEEQHRGDLLRTYGLEPRNRILLAGAPGNGKTSLAEAFAFELMVPFITVRYETLIGSYLGETASRLKNVFETAACQRCVLFFDEFDTLGKERGDKKEMGEIKRVVSSLLQQMDRLPSHVMVITASNHPELLDRAVWRRFQLRLDLPKPAKPQIVQYIQYFFEDRNINLGYKEQTLANHLFGLSFAEVKEFCLDILRRCLLEKAQDNAKSLVSLKLRQWKSRSEVRPESNGE